MPAPMRQEQEGSPSARPFAFPEGVQVLGRNLYSLVSFHEFITRLFETVGIASVCEIGIEFGQMTRWLTGLADEGHIAYVGVDPAPRVGNELFARNRARIVVARSLDFFRSRPGAGFDLYLIDGDHNYFTVKHELAAALSPSRPGKAIALVHDVLWPCGRRDFYYAVGDVPPEARHPYAMDARILPGNSGTAPYGLESVGQFGIALAEGGPRNGVLTAVEDAVAEGGAAGRALRSVVIPYAYGLAVVWDEARLSVGERGAMQALAEEIGRVAPMLQRLETNRIDLFTALIAAQQREAEHVARAKMEALGSGLSPPSLLAAATPPVTHPAGPATGWVEWVRLGLQHYAALRRPRTIRRLADLARHIDQDIDVVSFDFYETLVHRRVAPPDLVKWRTASFAASLLRRMGHAMAPAQFQKIRDREERRLRDHNLHVGGHDHECRLDEILSATLGTIVGQQPDPALLDCLVEFEAAAECAVIQAAPGARDVLKSVQAMGKRIVITTDMYLAEAHIRRIAEAAGLAPHVERYYVSAEHKRAKHSGRLFDVIAQDLAVPPGRLLHVGDSLIPDYLQPSARGVRAVHLFDGGAIRHRDRLAREIEAFNGRQGPASRADRRLLGQFGLLPERWAEQARAADLRRVLAGVAPSLLAFGAQALHDILALAVDRVYFIAREGIFLEKLFAALGDACLAWRLAPRRPVFKVLRVSRLALVAAQFTSIDDVHTLLDLVQFRHGAFSLANFLSAWGLDRQGFSPAVAALVDAHQGLTDADAFVALLRDTPLGPEIAARLTEARRQALGYLVQEGLLDGGRVALVDTGWGATIQSLLTRLLREAGAGTQVFGLYLGADRRAVELDAAAPQSHVLPGYVLDYGREPVTVAALRPAFPVIETLVGDDREPSTRGYAGRDGRWEPVPTPHRASAATIALQDRFQSAVLALAPDFMRGFEASALSPARIVTLYRERLQRYLLRPRAGEIAELAAAEFAYDWGDPEKRPLLLARSLAHWLAPRRALAGAIRSAWPQASLHRLGFPFARIAFNRLNTLGDRYPGLRGRLAARLRRRQP